MAEDYYTDGPPASEPTDNGAEEAPANTALLPKSFFPGGETEPGKTCTVRVTKVHDDQVEVEYLNSDEGDDVLEEAPEPPEAPAPQMGMAEMMS